MSSIGQAVKIKLKNVGKQLNKLQSPWSEALTIQSINGPVREMISKSRKICRVHSDKVIAVRPNLRPEPPENRNLDSSERQDKKESYFELRDKLDIRPSHNS